MNDDNLLSYFLIIFVSSMLIFTVIRLNHVQDVAYKTEKIITVACDVYSEKDPQLALICAKNGF